ncbi:hypothetical protein ACQPUY_06225 [Clostridium nigeriense]|uniref:hypothetical protein n=1 Tax=Clostridium nigeriense TaxID=1805470 RepID=UPI003D356F85
MARPLIFSKKDTKFGIDLSVNTNINTKPSIVSSINVEKELRKKRSDKYMDLCKILDANGCSLPQQYVDDIVNRIKGEFNELGIPEDKMPITIVAKCYLGENFEVHKLDMIGRIVCHFRDYEKMDPLSERARNLSQNPNYEFIEVYTDYLRAIYHDGSVSEVRI